MRVIAVPLLSWMASLVLVASACADFVPGKDARIRCAADGDCPDQWHCNARLTLCVPDNLDDRAPPTASAVSFTPPTATIGVDVIVAFTVSEALGADPLVDVDGAATLAEPEQTDETALRYAFRYQVTGDELGPGQLSGAVDAHADLVDDAGNEGTVTLGALALDLEPPEVQPIVFTIGKAAVQPDDVVTFTAITEANATVVEAHVVDAISGAVLGDATATTTQATGQTQISGVAPLVGLALADGRQIAIDLVVADAVGNQTAAGSVRSSSLLVDGTAPTGTLTLVPAVAITTTLDVLVQVDSADATLVCFRGDVVPAATCDADASFAPIGTGAFPLTLSAAEGAKVVEAVLRDAALNTTTGVTATTAFVPSGVLRSQPVLVPPAGQTALKDGDAITVAGSAQRNTTIESAALLDADAGFAVVQSLPAGAVALAADGSLSGTFVAAAVPDGHALVLEVIVAIGALRSEVQNSRSEPVQADNTPPQAVSVSVQEGAAVQSTAVHLVIAGTGATEMFIDGDIDDAANVRTFVPFQVLANVPLTLVDGTKNIQVRLRDGAHNEAIASTQVQLNRTVPGVSPLLVSPHAGVPGVKANDVVTVDGSADADVRDAIVSATLQFVDAGGVALAGAGCAVSVTGQVSLGPANPRRPLLGSINVGVPCAGARGVVLRVIVATAAGVESDPGPSTSASLFVDVTAPSGTAALVADASLNSKAGFTRSRTVSLQVSADDGGGPVLMAVSGDVVGLAATPFPVPASGALLVDLQDVDGLRTVTVVLSDAVGNERTPINALVTLDRLPPLQPAASTLQLREQSDAPTDPALVSSSNSRFFLSGQANAIVNGDRAFAYSDVGLTQRLRFPLALPSTFDLPQDGRGGFDEEEVGNDGSHRVFVTAVDNAGNESAPQTVAVPVFTFGSIVTPHNAGLLSVPLTSSLPLTGQPIVQVAGAAGVCIGTGTTFSCTYAPTGLEPAGVDRAVVRAFGDAAASAPGTTGTDARTITFDFTPPSIDAGKLVLGESDPGTPDQLAGLAAAVRDLAGTDDVTALGGITVSVFTGANGTGTRFGPVPVQADGSIDLLNVGDNAAAQLFVRATDAAGNSAEVAVANDVAPPVVSGVSTNPTIARSGAAVSIGFSVQDATHDLRANPVVTVGGRAAIFVSGNLATAGVSRAFVYSFTPLAGTDTAGARTVAVTTTDTTGNTSTPATATLTLDFTNPTVVDVLPGVRSTWNGLPSIGGTAADVGSSVALVEVAVLDTTANRFFDGGAFGAVAKTFVATSGTTAWSLGASPPYVEGHGYSLTFRATDAAGNLSTEGGPLSWTHDATAPDTTITSASPGTTTSTSQAFTFTSNDVTATFSCSLDGGAFSGCTSPATFNDLSVGAHVLQVRATDPAGNVDPTPASQSWTLRSVFVDVSGESSASCAVAQDHSLWCWGNNDQRTHFLFPPPAGLIATPTQVGVDRDWQQVSVADDHQCAVKIDGRLFCWGNNANGQLGVVGVPQSSTPLEVVDPVTPNTPWTLVRTGASDTCALNDSAVFCWGRNNNTECDGFGNAGRRSTPQIVSGFAPAPVDVRVSPTHACVLLVDGALQCWGSNSHGEIGANLSQGIRRIFSPISFATPIDAFAVGNGYTLVISDGQLFGMGEGTFGQLGDATVTSTNALTRIGTDADWTDISTSTTAAVALQGGEIQRHSCGLRSGRLFCFGSGERGEVGSADRDLHTTPLAVGTDADWVQIVAGSTTNIGRRSNGTTMFFGGNDAAVSGSGTFGHRPTPAAGAAVLAMDTGQDATCRVLAGGALQCAGDNVAHQLGDGQPKNRALYTTVGSAFVDVAAGFGNFCGLRSSGVLACWGRSGGALVTEQATPFDLAGHLFSKIAVGLTSTCGVAAGAEAGQLFCAGLHEDGTNTPSFARAGTSSSFVAVATAHFSVCALDGAGVVSCYGDNTVGAQGNGTVGGPPQTTLTPIVGGRTFTKLSGGGIGQQAQMCALEDTGRLFCWGANSVGQLGNSQVTASFVGVPTEVDGGAVWLDVDAGGEIVCAIRNDHALLCWGFEPEPIIGITSAPTVITAETSWGSVRARGDNGSAHVCATRLDGTGACFGRGAFGALGDGNGFFETPVAALQP